MLYDGKIPISNIYYMMAYAYKELTEEDISYIDPEQFDDLHCLMAEIIILRTSYQLKKGLLHSYEEQGEELSVVRGRINITETINRGLAVRCKLFCEFDEYVSDTLMNRILKSVMLLLLRSDIRPEQSDRLKGLLRFFSGVECTELRNVSWERLSFSRHNADYRFLMTICRMIAENMIYSTEDGDRLVKNISDTERLSNLYEKFLLGYFRRVWGDRLNVEAPYIDWDCDSGDNYLPKMRTDLVLRDEAQHRKLIIDAKFYNEDTQNYSGKDTLISGHLYQIFAYVTNASAACSDSVSGMMLYAKSINDKLPLEGCSYDINGHRYSFRVLDLDVPWKDIRESLDGIAKKFME